MNMVAAPQRNHSLRLRFLLEAQITLVREEQCSGEIAAVALAYVRQERQTKRKSEDCSV